MWKIKIENNFFTLFYFYSQEVLLTWDAVYMFDDRSGYNRDNESDRRNVFVHTCLTLNVLKHHARVCG